MLLFGNKLMSIHSHTGKKCPWCHFGDKMSLGLDGIILLINMIAFHFCSASVYDNSVCYSESLKDLI